jgi:LDH2 family malate/lactate/ureidoglycolate dehydrogenase
MEVEGFADKSDFKSAMDHWIQSFKGADRVDENQRVFVPGEKEYAMEVERSETGIPLNDKVIEDLTNLGKTLGVGL